jgi:UDP-N-acetylglucosamine 2-epimerase (non-hydrolysing)
MERLEPVLLAEKPDVVLVYGDVNSTVAAALVASKLGITVGHVEAGLRSRDRGMPEELNRIVTDHLADRLFAPSRDAIENLCQEGRPPDSIEFVGNVMIDSLILALPEARALGMPGRHALAHRRYTLATLHRPANVDDSDTLCELLETLTQLAADGPVLFPVHPRTRARIGQLNGNAVVDGVRLMEPLPYLEMLGLVADAALVITDSGGLQEETTWLGVPCVTVRPTTERPITCSAGTNRLTAPRRAAIQEAAQAAQADRPAAAPTIERWDGSTGERIAAVLCDGARFT